MFKETELATIGVWSRQKNIHVEIRLVFDDAPFRIIFSFMDPVKAKVWNYSVSSREPAAGTMQDLINKVLKEAERVFNK